MTTKRVELGEVSKFRGLAALIDRFGPEAEQGAVLEAQHEERRAWKEVLAKLTRPS